MDPISSILGFSGIFTVLLTCGICVFSLVVTAASIAIPIYFYRNQQKRAQELIAKGTQGEATILSLEDTGMLINNQPRVTMLLEIRMPYGAPYQVKKTLTVPLIRLSQIQVGSVVQVMVDMSDPTNPDKVGLLLK